MTTKLSFVLLAMAILVPSAHGRVTQSTGALVGTWINDVNVTDNSGNADGLLVSNNGVLTSPAGTLTQGLLEFDLSGFASPPADLFRVTLNLTVAQTAASAVPGQTASLYDANETPTLTTTWTTYQAEYAGTEDALTSLGVVATGGAALTAGTVVSTVASAFDSTSGDLTLIRDILNGGSGSLASFSFVSADVNTTGQYWGGVDGGFGGEAILTLEYATVCGTCNEPLAQAVWFREGEPDANHVNDGVIITNDTTDPPGVTGAPATGVMEWDLSGYSDDPNTLVDVQLTFFSASSARTVSPGQTAGLIDINVTQTSGLTFNTYAAEYAGTETALESLGVIPIGTGPIPIGSGISTSASAADLALIKALLADVNGSQLLTMAMFADGNETNQYWGDGSFGTAPVLTLSFTGPITAAGDFDGNGTVDLGDYATLKSNWLKAGLAYNTDGEVTNDGVVNAFDFVRFKNQLFPGGASAFAAALEAASAVPEPNTLLLILAAVPVWLVARPRRRTLD